MTLRIFPVQGGAGYTNDYHDPRSGGRSHQGNDLFAAEGTPLLAVDDGTVRYTTDPLGGNVIYLKALDGVTYYYAHLSRFEGGDRSVRAGELIGYLGKTGNAATTEPHLHFEVHPPGTVTNPYQLLKLAAIQQKPVAPPSPPTPQPAASSSWNVSVWTLGGLGLAGYLLYRHFLKK